MKMVSSKKYNGVYHTVLGDGDVTYYIYYRDEKGRQRKDKVGRRSEGMTEDECNRIRLNTIASVKNGEPSSYTPLQKKNGVATLNDLADFYFENQSTANSKNWKSRYERRIRDGIGEKDSDRIGGKELDHFRQKLIEEKLSNSTINCYIDIIGAVFNYAIRMDAFVGINPTKVIKKLRVDNIREKFLNNKEITDLLKRVEADPLLYLFTKLALSTGGRLQTILDIRKRDIDLENAIIILNDYKNGSTYKGYICDDELSDLLRFRMSLIGNNDCVLYENGISDVRRHISRKLNVVFYDLFNYDLDQNDANYRKHKVVIHTLRHTFLSHLAIKGTSPLVIKRLSNHKSMDMVERYAKLNPSAGKDEVVGLYGEVKSQ
jgi:integrase